MSTPLLSPSLKWSEPYDLADGSHLVLFYLGRTAALRELYEETGYGGGDKGGGVAKVRTVTPILVSHSSPSVFHLIETTIPVLTHIPLLVPTTSMTGLGPGIDERQHEARHRRRTIDRGRPGTRRQARRGGTYRQTDRRDERFVEDTRRSVDVGFDLETVCKRSPRLTHLASPR